jgi:transcriptional regulator
MYIPKAFQEDDSETLHALMQTYNFATLVTQQDGVPFGSQLPFLLDTKRGSYGTIMGHMARANAQWRTFHSDQEVLIIFQGPHAYISPSWYEVELSVPTWNYAVIHAYGLPRFIEDKAVYYEILRTLVQKHEAHFANPWPFQLPDDYVQKMMQGTVGFEIEITRLEGKFKLSQNRSVNDQERVIAALQDAGDELSVGVAKLMREGLDK